MKHRSLLIGLLCVFVGASVRGLLHKFPRVIRFTLFGTRHEWFFLSRSFDEIEARLLEANIKMHEGHTMCFMCGELYPPDSLQQVSVDVPVCDDCMAQGFAEAPETFSTMFRAVD